MRDPNDVHHVLPEAVRLALALRVRRRLTALRAARQLRRARGPSPEIPTMEEMHE